jgi:plasmid stabilization system protein ParE
VKYLFHAAARIEHLDQVAFYESRQKGLGLEYLAEFEDAISRILEGPERYRVVVEPNIRRYRLVRFPFWVMYRVVANTVQILAVAHFRKRPSYWVPRV